MNDRIGEQLWSEWDGELYEFSRDDNLVYYTNEHIDYEIDVVKRALASALQRDGIADSLLEAFRMIENSSINYGWAGSNEGDLFLTACDEFGETFYGDILDKVSPVTFIEFE